MTVHVTWKAPVSSSSSFLRIIINIRIRLWMLLLMGVAMVVTTTTVTSGIVMRGVCVHAYSTAMIQTSSAARSSSSYGRRFLTTTTTYASRRRTLAARPRSSIGDQRRHHTVQSFRHHAFLGSDYHGFSSSALSEQQQLQQQQQQQQQQWLNETVLTTPEMVEDIVVATDVELVPPPPPKSRPTVVTATKTKTSLTKPATKPKAVASNNYNSNYHYDDDDNYDRNRNNKNNNRGGSTTTTSVLIDPNTPPLPSSTPVPAIRAAYHAARYPPVSVVKTIHDYPTLEDYLSGEGIESRPRVGGTWQVDDPLKWTRDFGRRSPEYDKILQPLIRLRPGDAGYFAHNHDDDHQVPGVTIVRTPQQARIVLERLMTADPDLVHGCDTEVMDIDLKTVGPVGNGYCTCVSIYSGPDFDYGLGQGPGSTLWIDNLDDACGLLQEFKPWFESETFKKVWHNYGFDRHIIWNEGIDARGFWGDTMHMARLQDTSRSKITGDGAGYGLDALTEDLLKDENSVKVSMKELFGVKRLRKDGTEGSLIDLPPVEVLQRDPNYRANWIKYSAKDAKSTWLLWDKLRDLLKQVSWIGPDTNMYEYYELHMRPFGEVLTDMERRGIRVDAKDYLASVEIQAREDRAHHVEVFRQWAAKMIGANGLALNTASSVQLCTFLFGGAANEKTREPTETVREFKVPRDEVPEDALEAMRLEEEEAAAKILEASTDSQPTSDIEDARLKIEESLMKMKATELKALCKEKKLKMSGKKKDLVDRLLDHATINEVENVTDDLDSMSLEDLRDASIARGILHLGSRDEVIERLRQDIQMMREMQEENHRIALNNLAELTTQEDVTKVSKFVTVRITSLGLVPDKFTALGTPSVTSAEIKKLAGDPFADKPKYGTAYEKLGKEGCEALFSLCAIGSIDTMIGTFLTNLQELSDHQGRIHCSLNLNTETGRLSSRRPNLQNQPALEKDKYKIRKAFQSSPGNNLIVADYGQLELRLLASMTNCQSMINAFAAGGDFHSRTALDMFDNIKKALEDGECLLEWDYTKGEAPKPLLKDKFASERRKAKTLNFSIAYGKTAHGLQADWDVPFEEAEGMLNAWYAARPEVKLWQDQSKAYAKEKGTTRTLMGRYRHLPYGKQPWKVQGQTARASINTPIQGGAADIAMMAMNKINQNLKLKRLGWILLLQIHDEVILEGPEETSEEAFEEVKRCMEQPWVFGLKPTAVPLLVDGSHNHKTWYDAK